jgi:hypothetical protein
MSKEDLSDELAAVEAALGSVGPGPSRLDRDRVMFLAGRASLAEPSEGPTYRSRRWAWPAAFSAMTAVAATLLTILVAREPQPQVVQVIQPPSPIPTSDIVAGPQREEAPDALAVPKDPGPPSIWDTPPTVERERTPPLLPTPYGRQLGVVLAQSLGGASDSLPSSSRPRRRLPRPVSYRELLRRVAQEAVPNAVFPARPPKHLLFPQGADS